MTQMTRRPKNSDVKGALSLALSGVCLVLVLYFSVWRETSSKRSQTVEFDKRKEDVSSESSEIVSGTASGIAYYHCGGSEEHLVLLHGAAFSKEEWNSSGILSSLCTDTRLSVTALDLPVSAGHTQLKSLLIAMEESALMKRPVALVTPSASGKTITEWLENGDVSEIPLYVSKWIPVAAGSVAKASDSQLSSLKGNLPTFAIYGSRDAMGKRVSERLATLSGANVLEIDGGHPAYLDSPKAFVAAVLMYLLPDT
jgi:pimeloyl-ACP methyl ester carboxylesterase